MAEGVEYPTEDHITADSPAPEEEVEPSTDEATESTEAPAEGATTAGGVADAAPAPDATEGTVPG